MDIHVHYFADARDAMVRLTVALLKHFDPLDGIDSVGFELHVPLSYLLE
jgi:hypothetical protein